MNITKNIYGVLNLKKWVTFIILKLLLLLTKKDKMINIESLIEKHTMLFMCECRKNNVECFNRIVSLNSKTIAIKEPLEATIPYDYMEYKSIIKDTYSQVDYGDEQVVYNFNDSQYRYNLNNILIGYKRLLSLLIKDLLFPIQQNSTSIILKHYQISQNQIINTFTNENLNDELTCINKLINFIINGLCNEREIVVYNKSLGDELTSRGLLTIMN